MSAEALAQRLERLGVRLDVEADRLVVDAPRGVLTADIKAELVACKPQLLRLIGSGIPLADFAADRLPVIRFTIRETGDTWHDFGLLGRVRQLIQEFQPGGNHVYLRIVTTDRRRVVVEWRAVADRRLRMAIAQILAHSARPDL